MHDDDTYLVPAPLVPVLVILILALAFCAGMAWAQSRGDGLTHAEAEAILCTPLERAQAAAGRGAAP